jgi:hypothetical protein
MYIQSFCHFIIIYDDTRILLLNFLGPQRLPIIGNLLTLESEEPSHIIFTRLRDTYGDIFSIDFGSRR